MKTLALCFVLFATQAFGNGSVNWSQDLSALVEADHPALRAMLESTFDMDQASCEGLRINNQSNFGGRRVGPYDCRVSFKKRQGQASFQIQTRIRVQDASGADVDLYDSSAASLLEAFDSFELKVKASVSN